MARKGLSGQLNMFDFFRELEALSPQAGELEMVSLMPVEEPEIEAEPTVEEGPEVEAEPMLEVEPIVEVGPEVLVEAEVEAEPEVEPIVEVEPEVVIETEQKEEVEEVELVELVEETEAKITSEEVSDRPAMRRVYATPQGTIEIAYINYNKVRITEPGKSPVITEFEASKEAVDFYVEQMQNLEDLYGEE